MSCIAFVCRYWLELVEELATSGSNSAPFILLVMSVKMCSRRQDQQKASRHWKSLTVVSLPLPELDVPQEGGPW